MEAQHSEKPQEVAFGMTVLTCNYSKSLKAIATWAIDLMLRLDNRKIERIEAVVSWCQQNNFG